MVGILVQKFPLYLCWEKIVGYASGKVGLRPSVMEVFAA